MLLIAKILVAILAYIAGTDGSCEAGLRVRYDVSLTYGDTSYFAIPRTISEAESEGWIKTDRPESYLSQLVMYCYEDYVICPMFEADSGIVAGMRISYPHEYITGQYDWLNLGFINWTLSINGTDRSFWSNEQYYVSEELLALSPEERAAARDSSKTLSAGYVWVRGIKGEVMQIPATYDELKNDTRFTQQACLPWMGYHFYANMTKDLPCTSETLMPWFILLDSGEAVSLGLYVYGIVNYPSSQRCWSEYPTEFIVRSIVPDGPQCVYDLAGNPGMTTMHTYFVDKTRSCINCLSLA